VEAALPIHTAGTHRRSIFAQNEKKIIILIEMLASSAENDAYLVRHSPQINMRMRSILVAWLLEVTISFKCAFGTFMSAVQYLDRFLAIETVIRSELQLVGVTAFWIASKMVEIFAPEVRDMCYICNNAYTCDQVLQTERRIVKALNFDLKVHLTCFHAGTDKLAAALYLVRRSSLKWDNAGVRKTVRAIRLYLNNDVKTTRCTRSSSDRIGRLGMYVEQLEDRALNLAQSKCTLVGASD
jgi:hypothetical protein